MSAATPPPTDEMPLSADEQRELEQIFSADPLLFEAILNLNFTLSDVDYKKYIAVQTGAILRSRLKIFLENHTQPANWQKAIQALRGQLMDLPFDYKWNLAPAVRAQFTGGERQSSAVMFSPRAPIKTARGEIRDYVQDRAPEPAIGAVRATEIEPQSWFDIYADTRAIARFIIKHKENLHALGQEFLAAVKADEAAQLAARSAPAILPPIPAKSVQTRREELIAIISGNQEGYHLNVPLTHYRKWLNQFVNRCKDSEGDILRLYTEMIMLINVLMDTKLSHNEIIDKAIIEMIKSLESVIKSRIPDETLRQESCLLALALASTDERDTFNKYYTTKSTLTIQSSHADDDDDDLFGGMEQSETDWATWKLTRATHQPGPLDLAVRIRAETEDGEDQFLTVNFRQLQGGYDDLALGFSYDAFGRTFLSERDVIHNATSLAAPSGEPVAIVNHGLRTRGRDKVVPWSGSLENQVEFRFADLDEEQVARYQRDRKIPYNLALHGVSDTGEDVTFALECQTELPDCITKLPRSLRLVRGPDQKISLNLAEALGLSNRRIVASYVPEQPIEIGGDKFAQPTPVSWECQDSGLVFSIPPTALGKERTDKDPFLLCLDITAENDPSHIEARVVLSLNRADLTNQRTRTIRSGFGVAFRRSEILDMLDPTNEEAAPWRVVAIEAAPTKVKDEAMLQVAAQVADLDEYIHEQLGENTIQTYVEQMDLDTLVARCINYYKELSHPNSQQTQEIAFYTQLLPLMFKRISDIITEPSANTFKEYRSRFDILLEYFKSSHKYPKESWLEQDKVIFSALEIMQDLAYTDARPSSSPPSSPR